MWLKHGATRVLGTGGAPVKGNKAQDVGSRQEEQVAQIRSTSRKRVAGGAVKGERMAARTRQAHTWGLEMGCPH
eukprot:CAMPEP_0117688010 /NCGR_PEP_ID=MMETSP0804-20121206/23529_1 /TAXON_ID=1074897 /ORGANISM="Tetraselmis astigmatica, Strain CCMP880" /LENGTH=73 /DNA_ID=CAMNT_0005500289 /DNA_START=312 /DNA_END=530 /DNA_ORIENTATION=+